MMGNYQIPIIAGPAFALHDSYRASRSSKSKIVIAEKEERLVIEPFTIKLFSARVLG